MHGSVAKSWEGWRASKRAAEADAESLQTYDFQGQCCAQTTFCTPWPSIGANLRPHSAFARSRHHSLCGVGSAASAETPSSSPLHGRTKMTCCTHIYTVRLSDTCCGGLHTWLVHWPSAWRAAMVILSGLELQENRISQLCLPNARPTGCAHRSKGSAHMPTAWEGVPGYNKASPWKKTYDIVGQTYVCQHTMSMFNTTSYVILRYCILDIRYRMSKTVPMISYTICTYDVVCTQPTTSYVFLNLRYRILVRYVFLRYRLYVIRYRSVTYDIFCTWYDILGQSTILL